MEDFSKLTVVKLKAQLSARKLSKNGKKADLVERLTLAVAEEQKAESMAVMNTTTEAENQAEETMEVETATSSTMVEDPPTSVQAPIPEPAAAQAPIPEPAKTQAPIPEPAKKQAHVPEPAQTQTPIPVPEPTIEASAPDASAPPVPDAPAPPVPDAPAPPVPDAPAPPVPDAPAPPVPDAPAPPVPHPPAQVLAANMPIFLSEQTELFNRAKAEIVKLDLWFWKGDIVPKKVLEARKRYEEKLILKKIQEYKLQQ